MTYFFVENQTSDALIVETFPELDLILQNSPTAVYRLAPGEARAVLDVKRLVELKLNDPTFKVGSPQVFSWGVYLVNLHLDTLKTGWRVGTGKRLRVRSHHSGNLDV